MSEVEVWENERDFKRLALHARRRNEERLGYQDDHMDDENQSIHFEEIEGKEFEFKNHEAGFCCSSKTEEKQINVVHDPIEYKLPPEIWSRAFSGLDLRNICIMASTCPFFYKIVGVDFKRLCREFNLFRHSGEIWPYTFSEYRYRLPSNSEQMVRNYKAVFHQRHDKAFFYVIDLDMEANIAIQIPKAGEIPLPNCFQFYADGTKIQYMTWLGEVYFHDVKTGAVLAYLNLRGRENRENKNHYATYRVGERAVMFNGITAEFRQTPIPPKARLACAGCNDQHDYCVFETWEKRFVYDSRTERRYEFIVCNRKDQWYPITKILAASNSLTVANARSFRIYDIQTKALLLEFQAESEQRLMKRYPYIVINDFVVVERGGKQIFYYDEDDRTWKSSKTAPSNVQQQVYRQVFGSTLMAESLWYLRANLDTLMRGSAEFMDMMEERFPI